MSKKIFQAAANIRKAESADEAFGVALLFLSSPDAMATDKSEAGTFLADVKTAFDAHNAPGQYKMLLNMTRTLKNPSEHLKDSADKALAQQIVRESRQKYENEAGPVLIQSARTLQEVVAFDKLVEAASVTTVGLLDTLEDGASATTKGLLGTITGSRRKGALDLDMK